MSGSGSREGFGLPPWDPADPVPELENTQTLPGLGAIPGAGATAGPGSSASAGGPGHNGASAWTASERPDGGKPAPGSGSAGRDGAAVHGNAPPGDGAGVHGNAPPGDGAGVHGNGLPGEAAGVRGDGPPGDGGDGGDDTEQPDGAGPAPQKQQQRRRRRPRSALVELVVLGVIAIVLALIIKSFVVQPFYIPSSSMENTLEIGDRVLVNKLVYDFRGIHRGDIIVFDGNGSWDFNPPGDTNIFSKSFSELEGIVGISHDSSIYIKRVIGLPGDHVVCCNANGQITVNGVALSEQSYLFPQNAPSKTPFKDVVPAGRLWVMGDHRFVSYDSRGHMGDPGGGTIPESAVIGRAFVIIWPPSRWGILNIPATFEQPKLNASAAAAGGSSAALAAAMDNGTPLQAAGPVGNAVPLAFGFAGAIPLTWLQHRARRRISARRRRR